MSYDEHLISMAGGAGEADVLGEIEARVAAASPGPWETAMSNDDYPPVTHAVITASHGDVVAELAEDVRADTQEGPLATGSEDAYFIAHARTDIPTLLAMVREQRAKLDRVEAQAARWATLSDGHAYYAKRIRHAIKGPPSIRAAITATEEGK